LFLILHIIITNICLQVYTSTYIDTSFYTAAAGSRLFTRTKANVLAPETKEPKGIYHIDCTAHYGFLRPLLSLVMHIAEVDQGQGPATTVVGQALFSATGLRGVSEPDDSDDVDDGDSREELVVKPRGSPGPELAMEVAAARLALVSTELREEGIAWPALEFWWATRLAPRVLE
jgi:hypothetical protein